MVTYEELMQRQLIKKIETVEKERYVSFHQSNYLFDLKSSLQFIEQGNAKYAVIAGYYAVLNVILWYFAKYTKSTNCLCFYIYKGTKNECENLVPLVYFNLKISEEDTGVHTNSIIVLGKFVKEERLKARVIELLESAKREMLFFTLPRKNKEEMLPLLLRQSADKRKKYTYYSSQRDLPKEMDQLNEAKVFLDATVKLYVSILENLQC